MCSISQCQGNSRHACSRVRFDNAPPPKKETLRFHNWKVIKQKTTRSRPFIWIWKDQADLWSRGEQKLTRSQWSEGFTDYIQRYWQEEVLYYTHSLQASDRAERAFYITRHALKMFCFSENVLARWKWSAEIQKAVSVTREQMAAIVCF